MRRISGEIATLSKLKRNETTPYSAIPGKPSDFCNWTNGISSPTQNINQKTRNCVMATLHLGKTLPERSWVTTSCRASYCLCPPDPCLQIWKTSALDAFYFAVAMSCVTVMLDIQSRLNACRRRSAKDTFSDSNFPVGCG